MDNYSDILLSAIVGKIQTSRKHLNVVSSSSALKGPTQYIKLRRNTLDNYSRRITASQLQNISRKKQNYISLTAKLDAMSPLKVLTRGYSVATANDNTLIKSVKNVCPGDRIRLTVSDGEIGATVADIKEKQNG